MFSSGCALIKSTFASMVSPSPDRDETHRHQNGVDDDKDESPLENTTLEQPEVAVENSKKEGNHLQDDSKKLDENPQTLTSAKQESDGDGANATKKQNSKSDVETSGGPKEADNVSKPVPVAPSSLAVPTDLNTIAAKPSPAISQQHPPNHASSEESQRSQDKDHANNDGWGSNRTPEFLYQMTNMLTDKENKDVIEWVGGRITIHNPPRLESDILKKYFRHSKFASFQRQMNYFGFRKIAGKGKMAPCSYVHESITSDIRSLLSIKRKTNKWQMKAMEKQREQQMQLLCGVNRVGPPFLAPGANNLLSMNSFVGGGLNPALGTGLPGLASAPSGWPGLLPSPGMLSPLLQQQTLNPLQQMQLQLHNQNMMSQLLTQNQLQMNQLQQDQFNRDSEGRK